MSNQELNPFPNYLFSGREPVPSQSHMSRNYQQPGYPVGMQQQQQQQQGMYKAYYGPKSYHQGSSARYYQSSGYKRPAPKKITRRNPKELACRRYYVSLTESMAQMGANEKIRRCKLGSEFSFKFRPGHLKRGSKQRCGDLEKGVIHEVAICSTRSTFSCDVLVSSPLIKSNLYDMHDRRGFALVHPGVHVYDTPYVVALSSVKYSNPIMSDYQNLTKDDYNVGQNYEELDPETGNVKKYRIMPTNGFVWKTIEGNQNNDKDPYSVKEFIRSGTNSAMVPEKVFNSAVLCLQKQAEPQLLFSNMNNMFIEANRADNKWDTYENFPGHDQLHRLSLEYVKNQKCTISMVIKITYSLGGEEQIYDE